MYQVATAILVACSTLTFWIPWQTPFTSTSSYLSAIQSARTIIVHASNMQQIPRRVIILISGVHNTHKERAKIIDGLGRAPPRPRAAGHLISSVQFILI